MHAAFCTGHQLVLSRFEQDEQSIQIRLVTQVNTDVSELGLWRRTKTPMHSATKTVAQYEHRTVIKIAEPIFDI